MRQTKRWLVVMVFLVYPASYAALRLSDVLSRPRGWDCLGRSTTPREVRGPTPLRVAYQPLIQVEKSLKR